MTQTLKRGDLSVNREQIVHKTNTFLCQRFKKKKKIHLIDKMTNIHLSFLDIFYTHYSGGWWNIMILLLIVRSMNFKYISHK